MRPSLAWLVFPLFACSRAPETPVATRVDAPLKAAADAGQPLAPDASAPKVEPPPAPPEPVASPAEPDDRILEKTPGLTPTVPLVRVPAPKAAKDLAGTPGESPAMGPNDALVKVFVFSDFQCPVCRRAVEPLKKLARAYPADVQIIFKHLALSSHARAESAARASLAALREGRFWEFHDRAFDAQENLDEAQLRAHANAVGIDAAAFDKAFADPALAAQVTYESAQAAALGLEGTPAFVINGETSVGWGSYLGLESQVKVALEVARGLLDKGTPRNRVAPEATRAKAPTAASLLLGE